MIEIDNISYIYAPDGPFERHALNGVSARIHKGEFVGLIGHTGSGKSTLAQIICGLIRPTTGRIVIDGADISSGKNIAEKVRGKVGLVFQYPEHQLFEETVFADIAFGPKNLGFDEGEVRARVEESMDFVGLGRELSEKSPFELSGGQKRRAAIAGVLAMRPQILILDEPTAGLDPRGRDEILEEIGRLYSERGMTVILISHSMEDIAKVATRIMVMNEGGLAMFDTLQKVFSKGDELKKMSLNIPQISRVVKRLAESGIPIRRDIYTVSGAYEEVLRLLGEKNGD